MTPQEFEELRQKLKAGIPVTITRAPTRPGPGGRLQAIYLAHWEGKEAGVTYRQAQQLVTEGAINKADLRPAA